MLDRLAMVGGNIIVAPHRLELGTEAAELVDKRLNLGCGSGASRVHPERAQHEARHALPVVLRSPSARIEKNEAQDVALFRRQRSVVYEHHSRSPVPGDDVVFRISDKRRTRVQRVQHALQAWRGAVVLAVARFGRTAEAKQEKMLALDLRQHEGARDPVEHVSRGCTAPSLFEPSVPGRADIGPLGHFLAPKAWRAATPCGQAKRGRIELSPAVLQIACELVLARSGSIHPVSHYTGIRSLLYYNNPKAEACLQRRWRLLSCVFSSQAQQAGSARPS